MDFGWESEEEKILRYMNVPAKKKLEWLGRMHQSMVETYSRKDKKIFWKLREDK